MKIFICLDAENGMAFNRRRQSRDSAVCEKMLGIVGSGKLYMSEYSARLFEGAAVIPAENYSELADKDAFCFIETDTVPIDKAEELYIFRWDRLYPADLKFDGDPISEGFDRVGTTEFAGTSHEIITLEIYRRRNL